MNKGFVMLHRIIADNTYLWETEPFMNRALMFIDLILLASHKQRSLTLRRVKTQLMPGELAYSTVALSKRWKRSRGFVIKILKEFSQRGMIEVKPRCNTTIIRLVNWPKYQDFSPERREQLKTPDCVQLNGGDSVQLIYSKNELKTKKTGALAEHHVQPESPMCEQLKTPILEHKQQCTSKYNNVSEINNFIKEKIQSPDESGLCALFLQKMLENYVPKRMPVIDKWPSVISGMMNAEGITFEEIKNVIEFSQSSEFWKFRIRSVSKLRYSFDTLAMQMMEEKKKKPKLVPTMYRQLT
jgi:hypothetical protein